MMRKVNVENSTIFPITAFKAGSAKDASHLVVRHFRQIMRQLGNDCRAHLVRAVAAQITKGRRRRRDDQAMAAPDLKLFRKDLGEVVGELRFLVAVKIGLGLDSQAP